MIDNMWKIAGVTLPGSTDGILYYLTPDMDRLKEFSTWTEACLQIFYSLGELPAKAPFVCFVKCSHSCL